MTEFSDLAPDDQQAIGKTLLTLLTGFRNRDADALRAVHSPMTTSTAANPRARPRPVSGC
jgi:hypothetical protein